MFSDSFLLYRANLKNATKKPPILFFQEEIAWKSRFLFLQPGPFGKATGKIRFFAERLDMFLVYPPFRTVQKVL
ncbi:MAG TPA: hypothetical protein DCL14_06465 [Ruminococcaceae bacterium]|nr:hypothetical protein [Oscillospiraceae bacterium]